MIALVCRMLSYAWGFSADISLQECSLPLFGTIPFLWQTVISFAIGLVASFIAVRFSAFYLLLHEGGFRSFAFLMILLLNTHQVFFPMQPYSLSILLLIVLFFCLFGTYGRNNIPPKMLNVGFCVGLSAVLWSPSLLLAPFVLIQFYLMKSLSFKNLIAFFFGLLLPLWCCLPLLVLAGQGQFVIDNMTLLTRWGFSYRISQMTAWGGLYPALLSVLYLISFVHLQLYEWKSDCTHLLLQPFVCRLLYAATLCRDACCFRRIRISGYLPCVGTCSSFLEFSESSCCQYLDSFYVFGFLVLFFAVFFFPLVLPIPLSLYFEAMEGHSIGFRTLPNIFNPDLSLDLTFLMAVIRDFLCNLLNNCYLVVS